MKRLMNSATAASSIFLLSIVAPLQADFIIPSIETIENRQAIINHCNNYVDSSIKQFKKSQSLGCGFTGSRWSADRKGQFNWCVTVLEPFSMKEQTFREEALAKCQKEKTSSGNLQNQVAVPEVCKDSSKAYRPVKSINHHFRYETTLRTPVQNGLIRYDYNRDQKPDYVFLEAQQAKSRVVMCFSQGQAYRRQLTDITLHSDAGFASANTEISQQGDLLSVNIDYFEHNAGSSYVTATYRFDTKTNKFAIVKSEGDSSPVMYDGEPYPLYAPSAPKLF